MGFAQAHQILFLLVAFQQSSAWINSSKEALFKRSVQHLLLTSATLIQLSDKMIKANCNISRYKKTKVTTKFSLFYPYSFPIHVVGRTPHTWQKPHCSCWLMRKLGLGSPNKSGVVRELVCVSPVITDQMATTCSTNSALQALKCTKTPLLASKTKLQ